MWADRWKKEAAEMPAGDARELKERAEANVQADADDYRRLAAGEDLWGHIR